MVHHLYGADLGEAHSLIMGDAETGLGEGEALIAPFALEARIARSLTSFTTPEKGLHGKFNPFRHVLQDLGVDIFEGGTCLFQQGDARFGLVPGNSTLLLFPSTGAISQRLIIEPAALFKHLLKSLGLTLGWVYPVLKHLSHRQELRGMAVFPCLKLGGLAIPLRLSLSG